MNRGEAGLLLLELGLGLGLLLLLVLIPISCCSSNVAKAVGWFGSGGGEEQGVMASSSSVNEFRLVVVARRLGMDGLLGVGVTIRVIFGDTLFYSDMLRLR